MNAEEFIAQVGTGQLVAGNVIARVKGQQQYVFKDGFVTQHGLVLLREAMYKHKEDEGKRKKHAGHGRRRAYRPDEDDYELS